MNLPEAQVSTVRGSMLGPRGILNNTCAAFVLVDSVGRLSFMSIHGYTASLLSSPPDSSPDLGTDRISVGLAERQ